MCDCQMAVHPSVKDRQPASWGNVPVDQSIDSEGKHYCMWPLLQSSCSGAAGSPDAPPGGRQWKHSVPLDQLISSRKSGPEEWYKTFVTEMVVETSAGLCWSVMIVCSDFNHWNFILQHKILSNLFVCLIVSRHVDILDVAVDAGRRTMVQSLPGDPSNRTDVLPFPEAIQGVHLFVRRTEHYLDGLSDGWMERWSGR